MKDGENPEGQKKGAQAPEHDHGGDTGKPGERSDKDKQKDQKSNPDDAARTATDQQR